MNKQKDDHCINRCRLCDGNTKSVFELQILNKHPVEYLFCTSCKSLQTEAPYWLDDAYDESNLTSLDTGAAQRNIDNLAMSYTIAKTVGARNLIDVGGGDGLLCRLLRDYRLNCFVQDKYAQASYAQGYKQPDFQQPDLVMGFEVLEHFSNPASDLNDIFLLDADFLLFSTLLYTGQNKDWWYLVPETGQHVFFYSPESINFIARKYGYQVMQKCSQIFFSPFDIYPKIFGQDRDATEIQLSA